jgi:hypothetical protein
MVSQTANEVRAALTDSQRFDGLNAGSGQHRWRSNEPGTSCPGRGGVARFGKRWPTRRLAWTQRQNGGMKTGTFMHDIYRINGLSLNVIDG